MRVDRFLDREDFAALAGEVLARGGALLFTARGDSMRPFIRPDDVLETVPVGPHAPRPGDVLLCRFPSGRVVAHRLRATGPRGLLIQGDACAHPDGWLAPEGVLGRVVSLERGRVRRSTGGLPARLWLALAPLRPALLAVWRLLRGAP